MNKRDALKLRPGDEIVFGNSMWSEVCERDGGWRRGIVLLVTPNGGIRVQTTGGLEWVPYHHVLRLYRRPDNPILNPHARPKELLR